MGAVVVGQGGVGRSYEGFCVKMRMVCVSWNGWCGMWGFISVGFFHDSTWWCWDVVASGFWSSFLLG